MLGFLTVICIKYEEFMHKKSCGYVHSEWSIVKKITFTSILEHSKLNEIWTIKLFK